VEFCWGSIQVQKLRRGVEGAQGQGFLHFCMFFFHTDSSFFTAAAIVTAVWYKKEVK